MSILCVLIMVMVTGAASAGENWTLATGDTRLTLGIQRDQPVILSLESASAPGNWAGGDMVVPLMSKVWVGERESPVNWTFRRGETSRASRELALVFASVAPKLELRSIWRARPGAGPVEHWIEIRNLSAQRVTVSHQDSLSLSNLALAQGSEIWWIKRGAANASSQGGTYTERFGPGFDLALVSNCDDGASPVPWMAIQEGDRRGLYIGWEFSGIGRIEAKAAEGGKTLAVRVGNMPEFKTDVGPQETFLVPPAFVGCYAGDVEEGSYRLHRWILDKLRPPVPHGYPDPSLNCAVYPDGGGPNATEESFMPIPKRFQELGFEMFMTDAIWFPETGDWRWDPKRFPHGVKPIEEFLHKHGMKHGLWCSWTSGGVSERPDALSVRGKYGHPDWFNADYEPDWMPGPYYGAKACLACPEARQWAISKTQWLVREHKLDYLKHDTGPIVTICNKKGHRHSYGVDVSYWSTMGYYEVMEKLLEKCPGVVLENCSGAGHIKDFGVIRRTHYTASTDTLSNLPDRQSIYDSTYALPPMLLQCYTFERFYKVKGDDPGPFLWRSAMMSAWHIAPVNSGSWTEQELASVKRAVHIYKQWIRPILRDAKVHHILPRPDGVNWDGMFYWSPSLNKGTVYIFRPDSPDGRKTVKLKGLEPRRNYRLWCEDGSISAGVRRGDELMSKGIEVSLPESYTSDLIYIEAESSTARRAT